MNLSGKTREQLISEISKLQKQLSELTQQDEIVSISSDVSKVQSLIDDLKKSKAKYSELQNNVPIGLYQSTPTGQFNYVNEWAAKVLGYDSSEDLMRMNINDLYTDPEKRKELLLTLNERNILDDVEVRVKKKDGIEIWLVFNAKAIYDDNNEVIHYDGYFYDITERKQALQDLKLAKNKAEESDKLKTAFLANMSHEIRTPMNAIVGFSELLNDPDLGEETRKEFITLINDNSKLLLNLIGDIIDVAKIEAEQIKMVRSTCQVNQILDELLGFYQKELQRTGNQNIEFKIHKEIKDEKFAIISDPLRFRQVLNNLIGNAMKFTDSGSIEFGYIFLEEKTIQFFVKDTGIGLAVDKIDLIFERFRQVYETNTREYGGAGLGLTISKRLAELLGGDITVESEFGRGSTFYLNLPYEKVEGRSVPDKLADKKVFYNWTGKIIMVVEDEISNFELVKATLEKTNVSIVYAKNGLEAIDMFEHSHHFDLILMDIRMPVMNGYEATRKIRSADPDVPIISLTAYAMAEDRQKSLDAGCDAYLSKPIMPDELLHSIGKYLK